MVDLLLSELQSLSIHGQIYVDEVIMLAVDRNVGTVCRNMRRPLYLIDSWCLRHELSVNSDKIKVTLTKS